MIHLVPAEGPLLEQILDASYSIWSEGLSRRAYGKYYDAQLATAWGREHLRRWALVERAEVLASAKTYLFDATLDGRTISVVGLGAIFTQPAHRGRGHARHLVERLLDGQVVHSTRSARSGQAGRADLALLFSEIGTAYYARLGFTAIPASELTLDVQQSRRHGAPAVLVRAGDDRDLPAVAEMGRVRATPYRFRLERDRDLVQYAIAKKRLLAALGPIGARELQFFVAEEGAAAVAYVVISAAAGEWMLEEAGDRDPAGARVGAILQALIAREPAERRPVIHGWLPVAFRPPQLRIAAQSPSREAMMIRPLTARAELQSPLREEDVLFWHGDVF